MRHLLEKRFAELSLEIRGYPTPIARCDVQLSALLEERTRIFEELQNHAGCSPLALWINDGGPHAA